MSTPDPLTNMTQLLRGAIADEGDTEAMPERRDEAVAAVAKALRARRSALRRRRLVSGLAVAASIGSIVGAGYALHRSSADAPATPVASRLGRLVDPSGAATALLDGRSERVSGGDRLPEGTELRTTTAEASLDFEGGTHVTFGQASKVRLVEQSAHKRFSLESGQLTARVAKLEPQERFVVATVDAEIEVRGTAFRVSVVEGEPSCGEGTPTRLDVSEGVVVVRRGGLETRVSAGEHWPSCPVPSVLARPIESTPAPSAKPSVTPSVEPVPSASSRLAVQNDLFDEGMRLKRAGDVAGALVRFETLTNAYPAGPLTESATVERMRLLAATDKSRGVAAARAYLRAYPHGFARREAEALAP